MNAQKACPGSDAPRRLRVLFVEDSPPDAFLLMHALQRGGFEPVHDRVDTAEGLIAALDRDEWDVILADHSMPQFSAPEALELVKARQIDIPFIIVSGHIEEQTAVAAMKAGAHDYVMKDQLARLVPAVERELREAAVRRAQKEYQKEEAIRRAQGKAPRVQEGIAENGPVPAGRVRVPDLTGVPTREALKRAYEMGVNPRLSGSGLLVSQTPPPGSVVDKGQELLLVFEPAS
jgi:DNA-binding NtrC family response regulator